MNVRLEKLFLQHNLLEKDCYEIRQIYQILPSYKKQKLIDNFEDIVANINGVRQEIGLEQEILLGESLSNIQQRVSHFKKKGIVTATGSQLGDLKKQI